MSPIEKIFHDALITVCHPLVTIAEHCRFSKHCDDDRKHYLSPQLAHTFGLRAPVVNTLAGHHYVATRSMRCRSMSICRGRFNDNAGRRAVKTAGRAVTAGWCADLRQAMIDGFLMRDFSDAKASSAASRPGVNMLQWPKQTISYTGLPKHAATIKLKLILLLAEISTIAINNNRAANSTCWPRKDVFDCTLPYRYQ